MKSIKVFDCDEWDALVEKTYGKPYCFQQQDGCKNRGFFEFTVPTDEVYDEELPPTIPSVINGDEMGVRFSTWLTTHPNQFNEEWEVELFWHRNFYPDFGTIVNDLHKRGVLEEGEYGINIDW